MAPALAASVSHDGGRRRDALSIDALVDAPSRPRNSSEHSQHIHPPHTRTCGKCQEAHTRCDGRDPCRNCEVRGTLCGYAWSSASAPIMLPPLGPARTERPPPSTSYFPPPANVNVSKRPGAQRSPDLFPRSNPMDGGWAIVPVNTNAPAVTRGAEVGPPVTPCKTCQARNTACDGVLPVCGSCKAKRLECYIATPTSTASSEKGLGLGVKGASKPGPFNRGFPANSPAPPTSHSRSSSQSNNLLSHPSSHSQNSSHPVNHSSQSPQLAPHSSPSTSISRSRAHSSTESGGPYRASLSFMLNPTADEPRPSGHKPSLSASSHGHGRTLSSSSSSAGHPPSSFNHHRSPSSSSSSSQHPNLSSQHPGSSHQHPPSSHQHPPLPHQRPPSSHQHAPSPHHAPSSQHAHVSKPPVSSKPPQLDTSSSLYTRQPLATPSTLAIPTPTPTALVTPPTPVAASGMEQMQMRGGMELAGPLRHERSDSLRSDHMDPPGNERMDTSRGERMGTSRSERMDLDVPSSSRATSPSPLSPSSAGATLSRRASRKRSASPAERYEERVRYDERYDVRGGERSGTRPGDERPRNGGERYEEENRWALRESGSPSRESVSSAGVAEGRARAARSGSARRSGEHTHSGRQSLDSYPPSTRNSLDVHARSPDSPYAHPLDETVLDSARPRSRSKSSLSHLLDGDGFGGMGRPSSSPSTPGPYGPSAHGPVSKRASISTAMAGMQLLSATTSRASSPGFNRGAGSPGWYGAGSQLTNSPGMQGIHSPGIPAIHSPGMQSVSSLGWHGANSPGRHGASSPGRHGSGSPAWQGAAWPTFGAVGESMREQDGEEEVHGADLKRRKSEGGVKRRRLTERSMSDVGMGPMPEGAARRVEAKREVEESGLEKSISGVQVERRMSGIEMERRMSGIEVERRISVETDRRMSIVEHVRMVTDAQLSATELEHKTTDVPDSKADLRRGSIPMPGSWISESAQAEVESVVVVSDSPKMQSNDMVVEASESTEPLIVEDSKPSTPAVVEQSVEKSASVSVAPTSTSTPAPAPAPTSTPVSSKSAPAPPRSPKQKSAEAVRSSERDGRKGSTPPSMAFHHIWPTPPIPSPAESSLGKKGRRLKYDAEPAPSRSFITKLNLPSTPTGFVTAQPAKTPAKIVSPDDEGKDKDIGSSQPSALRSMLTTMPQRAVFMAAVQSFLSQPATKTCRARAVVMTKTLMKDTLSVLLDPTTEDLLKDYVPPAKEDKSSKDRDGTPARGRKASSVAIDSADHTSLEFRAWAKRMFSTVKNSRGEDVLAFGGKPVVVEDDIYETIVICHSQGNHCSADETSRLVDQAHSWVPKTLVRAFVQECPGCPASNKVSGAATKPKKRKVDRGTGKRKPVTRRSKKTQEGGRKTRKAAGKEVSPEESDGDEAEAEVEAEAEEDELKESGDEGGPSGDVKAEAEAEAEAEGKEEEEQEAEQEEEVEETEEVEMESEDEHVSAAPPSRPPVVASSVPDLENGGMEVDSGK